MFDLIPLKSFNVLFGYTFENISSFLHNNILLIYEHNGRGAIGTLRNKHIRFILTNQPTSQTFIRFYFWQEKNARVRFVFNLEGGEKRDRFEPNRKGRKKERKRKRERRMNGNCVQTIWYDKKGLMSGLNIQRGRIKMRKERKFGFGFSVGI